MISQLFQFDSRLVTLVPYICPQKDTASLCEILPTDLAIVWLIERLQLNSLYYLRISESKVPHIHNTSHDDLCMIVDGTLFQEAYELYNEKNSYYGTQRVGIFILKLMITPFL